MDRPKSDRFRQVDKIPPFMEAEYEARLTDLQKIIADRSIDACILTSTHNVSYYSGFFVAPSVALMRSSQPKPKKYNAKR